MYLDMGKVKLGGTEFDEPELRPERTRSGRTWLSSHWMVWPSERWPNSSVSRKIPGQQVMGIRTRLCRPSTLVCRSLVQRRRFSCCCCCCWMIIFESGALRLSSSTLCWGCKTSCTDSSNSIDSFANVVWMRRKWEVRSEKRRIYGTLYSLCVSVLSLSAFITSFYFLPPLFIVLKKKKKKTF